MSQSQAWRVHRIPSLEHASEEYVSFIRHMYATPVRHRDRLLLRHKHFVEHYATLHEWFAAPLPERVGRLDREDRASPAHSVSYEARHYLLFLALCKGVCFEWEWLVAIPDLTLGALPAK